MNGLPGNLANLEGLLQARLDHVAALERSGGTLPDPREVGPLPAVVIDSYDTLEAQNRRTLAVLGQLRGESPSAE
jgi:hypothetical protein